MTQRKCDSECDEETAVGIFGSSDLQSIQYSSTKLEIQMDLFPISVVGSFQPHSEHPTTLRKHHSHQSTSDACNTVLERTVSWLVARAG